MADIIDFKSKKKPAQGKEAPKLHAVPPLPVPESDKFNKSVAKQLLTSDPTKMEYLRRMGISLDTAIDWTLVLAEAIAQYNKITMDAHKQVGYSPQFGTLLVFALSDILADELVALAMCSEIDKKKFDDIKMRATSIVFDIDHHTDLGRHSDKEPEPT